MSKGISRLLYYKEAVAIKAATFEACMRTVGRFKLGPTNKGGVWLQIDGTEKVTALNVSELQDLKAVIDVFLDEVV